MSIYERPQKQGDENTWEEAKILHKRSSDTILKCSKLWPRLVFFFADKKSMNTIDNEKWIVNLVVQLDWLFSLVETEMIIVFCLKNDKN